VNTKRQQAVYDAERTWFDKGFGPTEAALTLMQAKPVEIWEAQHYLNHVLSQDWFKDAFPTHPDPVTVNKHRGRGADANRPGRIIRLSMSFRETVRECEHVLLHELAHIVTGKPDDEKSAGHGHGFRVHHVLLVRKMLGNKPAFHLRAAYREAGLATTN
jgi:putative metallohydrolase (TIGR04338 family)